MTIGLTGAGGMIGTSLVRHFVARGTGPLRVLLRSPGTIPADTHQSCEVYRGDLLSFKDCVRFVQGLSVIYILSHRNTPATSDLDLPNDALLNSVPFLNIVQAVRECGSRPHIVYFSSGGAMYGRRAESRPFAETDPCVPSSSYGIQKLAAEHYLRLAAERGFLSATILRVGNAYGSLLPPERLQGLVGVVLNHMLHGRPVVVFGNPANVRDYVHLDDICMMAERVMTPLEPFSVFNVGTQRGYSVIDVLDTIERVIGVRVMREFLHQSPTGAWLPDWCVLDIARAKSLLQWAPQVDLAEGIARMLRDVTCSELQDDAVGPLGRFPMSR